VRALKYFITEAAASLWRGRRSGVFAILTIAAGLFVLGFFLIVNTNVRRLTARWAESAELAVFLRDDAAPAQVEAVRALIADSGLAASQQFVTKEEAATRFAGDFPDLAASTRRLERNPFPASFDVRLRPDVRAAEDGVDTLAKALASQPGVSDVRYDRRWLARLNGVITFVRSIGLVIVILLAVASALTVASVVRLAAHARRDEIEIMKLVGAPLTYVRGPLVLEGVLQGGAGACVAIVGLSLLFALGRAKYGASVSEAVGLGAITFLPVELSLILLLGGMLLGSLGGLIVARAVR
jgi:cell division transport system permease protein